MCPDRKALIVVTLLILQSLSLFAREDKAMMLNLAGSWKFSIGDDKAWEKQNFNDSAWESIHVPSAWEDQGFYGYDGFGWYRTSFRVTREMHNKELFVVFGYIGDVDQVYLNGKLIGFSGSFPPHYSAAPDAKRKYPIPQKFLNLNDRNTIAVRVYNQQMEGGIVSGEVGIVSSHTSPDIPLAGLWYYKQGDNSYWKDTACKDRFWGKVIIPGNAENEGLSFSKGITCYRKHFRIDRNVNSDQWMLVLGRITGDCAVYINGIRIDSGVHKTRHRQLVKTRKEEETPIQKAGLRFFALPKEILKQDKMNIIAVKLIGKTNNTLLMDGPVGILKAANIQKFKKEFAAGEAFN